MSIEAIQRITQAEELAKEQKTAAAVQAKQIVKDAEQAGQALLETARQAAAQSAKQAMGQAEQAAAAETEGVYAKTRQVCQELSKRAEGRLDEAADLITKRIVSSAWPS